jgi:hypothetical protein
MTIQEALTIAISGNHGIRRKDWSYPGFVKAEGDRLRIFGAAPHAYDYHPTTEDILSDDWVLARG